MVPWFLQVSDSEQWDRIGRKKKPTPSLIDAQQETSWVFVVNETRVWSSILGGDAALSQNADLRGFLKSVCGLSQVCLHPPANAPPGCCQLQVKELSPPFYIQKIPDLMWEEQKGGFARGNTCSWRKSSQMWNLMLRSACKTGVGSSKTVGTNPTRARLLVTLLGNS